MQYPTASAQVRGVHRDCMVQRAPPVGRRPRGASARHARATQIECSHRVQPTL